VFRSASILLAFLLSRVYFYELSSLFSALTNAEVTVKVGETAC